MPEWNLPRARCSWTAFVGFITKITETGGALVPGQRVHGGGCLGQPHTNFFEAKVRKYAYVTSTEPRHLRRAHGGGSDG